MNVVKKLSSKKGFTILELIIVLVIIGILGAVLYPKFSGKEASSKISATEMDILRLYEAAKAYKSNHGEMDFTNTTKANMISDGLITDKKNSFGNTFTAGPKSGDATTFEVTTTADTTANAKAVADKLAAKNYTASNTTTSISFESN